MGRGDFAGKKGEMMEGETATGMREPPMGPVFHLYVAGATRRSTEAIVNLKSLLADLFKEGYELRVTDIYQDPRKAMAAGIQLTPVLIREYPAPQLRAAGVFSSEEKIRTRLLNWTSSEVPDE